MQNDRPTTTVELPISKAKVTLYTYLLNKDFREVKMRALKGASVDIEGNDATVKSFDASVTVEMQDLTLKRMIKSFSYPDSDVETIYEKIEEFVDNLPQQDGEYLYTRFDEVTKSSNLSEEAKKK